MSTKMLVPGPVKGTKDTIPTLQGYEWIQQLPDKKIYLGLFQGWDDHKHGSYYQIEDLPEGYDYYIISFHLETVNLPWLIKQKTTGPIIVLVDGNHYNLNIPGVHFIPFYYWHYQLEKMQQWFGVKEKIVPTHKFSAVCNRITQSKVWITTKLLETARESSLIVSSKWLEEKNVHYWQPTHNKTLDQLTETFRNQYFGKEIKIDDFVNDTHNKQSITGNPWQPLYQDCAVHFTNESFHYSAMTNDFTINDGSRYIWPGPFLTEKTLKCLLGATAFIPVGQFDTYQTLTNLGLQFDYDFDTAWERDPGNLSRAESTVKLVDTLNQFTVEELVSKTKAVNKYNQNCVVTGKFFERCDQKNKESIAQIFDLIR
jgi:hypothetical protein